MILAAEVGVACLFLTLLLVGPGQAWWGLAPAVPVIPATPAPPATASPTAVPVTATATPFLPDTDLVLVWGPGQDPPVMAALQARRPALIDGGLPEPPTPIPDIIPTPGRDAPATGPLNYPQQLVLYAVSLHYVAPTAGEALRLARELNFTGKDSHPSNMCGPLSMAILREAGLVSPATSLEEFWLLNPRQPRAQGLLARTFPAERFDHLVSKVALNQMDWQAAPLHPGDFLYLYAGVGGNFEHMLVVNRVDSAQRAFAVTNYATEEGFVIREMLLYDPHDKTAGLFATWTRRPYALLGSTGYGGFEIWRARLPQP